MLHEAGEPIDYVYFLKSGMVSLQVRLSGHSREVGFIGPEGIVGTEFHPVTRSSNTRAIVGVPSLAYRVPLDHFLRTVRFTPKLQELIAENNNRITQRAQQIAACNLSHPLDARLCRWMLQILRHAEQSEIVGTQEHISELLGVNRARLNEAMQALVQIGAIVPLRRGAFQILRIDEIEARACECCRIENFLKIRAI